MPIKVNVKNFVYECPIYRCKYVWIAPDTHTILGQPYRMMRINCPSCNNTVSPNNKVNNVNGDYVAFRITVPTYAKFIVRNDKDVSNYPQDAVILALIKNGFKRHLPDNHWTPSFLFIDNERQAAFEIHHNRKTSDLYLVVPKDDPIIAELKIAAKEATLAKKNAPKPLIPKIESMLDVTNQTLKVGDYVTYWATKSLEFGIVKSFVNSVSQEWGTAKKVVTAKIIKINGTPIPIPKYSNQLFLLPKERAMLLMLEKR